MACRPSARLLTAIKRNRFSLIALALISFVLYSGYISSMGGRSKTQHLDSHGKPRKLSSNPRQICNCFDKEVIPTGPEDSRTSFFKSSCSSEATLLGEFQKVVSYSLYLNPNKTIGSDDRYFFGAPANVEGVKKYYPGWVMRIYSNIPLERNNEMCGLICSDPIIYYCDTRRLPGLGNVTEIDPMRWRFFPIGDATVEKFIVRDLDSRISQRERDAVAEWEASNYSFHGMRDHPNHYVPLMGGMWGGDNFKLGFETGKNIRKSIIKYGEPGNDQILLYALIFSKHRSNFLTHDSYMCHLYKDSRSFPTRRENNHNHVGKALGKISNQSHPKPLPQCPSPCRPPDHQNWEYC